MRIAHLICSPFGPFNALALDFPRQDTDLQVIYGPNEAGKSTLLRAVEGFLYGIPARTLDNHTHDNKALQIGARLTLHSGGEVGAKRRKGNKDTLQPWGDGCLPLVESHLESLLEQITTLDQFRQLFGLTQAQMTEGSEVLLQTAGDLGISLASAGLGGRIREVQQALDGDCELLFKKGGSAQKLPKLMKELELVRAQLSGASIDPALWELLQTDEVDAIANRDRLSESLKELRLREAAIALRVSVVPLLLDLALIETELQPLQDVPLLAEGFTSERIGLEKDLRVAETELRELTIELAQVDEAIAAMPMEFPLLQGDLALRIGTLNRRIGAFEGSSADLPKRRAELQEKERAIAELRAGLPVALRDGGTAPDVALQADVRTLIERESQLERSRLANEDALRVAQRNEVLAQQNLDAIAAAPALTELTQALKRSDEARNLESDLRHRRDSIGELREAWEDTFNKLRFVTEPVEAFVARVLPLEATINQAITTHRTLQESRREIDRKLVDCAEEIARHEAALTSLLRSGSIPTLQELDDMRAHREVGWQHVRAVWLEAADRSVAEASWSDGAPLPEAYEAAVQAADSAADALRTDAEAVEQRRLLEDLLEQARARHRVLLDRHAQLLVEQETLDGHWRSEWEPLALVPGTPEEMLDWRRSAQSISEQWRQWDRLARGIRELVATVEQHRDQLAVVVQASGGTVDEFDNLTALRTEAQRLLDDVKAITTRGEERRQQLRAAQEARERAELDSAQVTGERMAWQESWDATLMRLGMVAGDSTASVSAILQCYEKIAAASTSAQDLRERIEKIERDIREFESDVDALLAEAGGSARTQAADLQLASLYEQLSRQRSDQSAHQAALDRRTVTRGKRDKTERVIRDATDALQRLLSAAQVASIAELPGREEASERRRQLEQQRSTLQQQLHRAGGGRALDELRELCEGNDETSMGIALDNLAEEREHLEMEREDAVRTATSARDARRHLEAQSGASELGAREAMLEAELREVAGDYLRLRLASALLASGIDTLRQSGDSPVLQRASHWFARLTNGHFSGLVLEQSGERQDIRGLRSGEEDARPMSPEQMSDGTRDQLYLALRLAIVEQYCQTHEPLPMILDDLLITFDDARTAATLSALAEFSQVTQVLLFTHHRSVCDTADSLGICSPLEVLALAR